MATTADGLIAWIENNWLGWQEPWYDDFIPWQEKHGYPRGVVVEWCGGLLMEGVWETGGDYGLPLPPKTASNSWYTPTGVAGFIGADRWTHDPQRGDFIFFDWQGSGLGWSGGVVDHVGIVTDASGWNGGRGYVDTIEGNINEACGRFRRWNNGTIRGFGRPDYANIELPPEPEPQPKPRQFVPFIEGDNDMLVIHIRDEDTKGIPRDWGVIGGVLFPIDAPEADLSQVVHVDMSLAIFQNYYAKYVWANRLNLDLTALKV